MEKDLWLTDEDIYGFTDEKQAEIDMLNNKIEKLEQENDTLKDDVKYYKEVIDKIKEYCNYNDECLYTFEPDYDYEENLVDNYEASSFREDILDILKEVE